MRILVLSNLYPPFHIGGYEIGCRDVVNILRKRGHTVRVLTSRYGGNGSPEDEDVFRELHEDLSQRKSKWTKLGDPFRERSNCIRWQHHIESFKPDVVYFWNLSHLGVWPIVDAAKRRIPTACYLSDQWFEDPVALDPWLSRFKEKHSLANRAQVLWAGSLGFLLGLCKRWPPEALPQLHYTSAFIEKGVKRRYSPPESSEVIHWGVADLFTGCDLSTRKEALADRIDLLFTGQIREHKGVRTAVQAAIQFLKGTPGKEIHFRIAGSGSETLRAELENLIAREGCDKSITFKGRLSRDELLKLYLASDIYIFPSEWDEPFAIAPLEAMACGCAVIGTTTGGSGEILQDGMNALTFEAGNPDSLAECLKRLCGDISLRKMIATQAANDIRTHHTLSGMVDRIESKLLALISQGVGSSKP